MKRRVSMVLFTLIGLSIFSQTKTDVLLSYLFDSQLYKTVRTSLVDKKNNELLISWQENGKTGGFAERAVVYVQFGQKIKLYLVVFGPFVFGSDGNTIVDVSSAPGKFYAWKMIPFRSTANGISGLELDLIDAGGKTEAEPIFLSWSSKYERFERQQIDPSLY